MKRLLIFGFVASLLLFSCKKKEEENEPKGNLTIHTAYVSGIVKDSITGLLAPGASIYLSQDAFSAGQSSGTGVVITDASGRYTLTTTWPTGTTSAGQYYSQPNPFYVYSISGYKTALNAAGYLQFTQASLIENDTVFMPPLFLKQYAYMSTHVQDVPPTTSVTAYLKWIYTVDGARSISCSTNLDSTVVVRLCSGLPVHMYTAGDLSVDQTLTVWQGDTLFNTVSY